LSPDIPHIENDISPTKGAEKSALHVLTLTPFFPSAGDEVSGCFIAESIRMLEQFGVISSIIAVTPIHHRRKKPNQASPADWVNS
jgi:hypothetical protein